MKIHKNLVYLFKLYINKISMKNWNLYSPKEKMKLMQIFIRNGITDLSQMQEYINSFDVNTKKGLNKVDEAIQTLNQQDSHNSTNRPIPTTYTTGGNKQSVEMTPSKAEALNKKLNTSQYMLAVGNSPEDPAYLSPGYLEPAKVKAFDSQEDYNRYIGGQFGDYVSNSISNAGTKLAPVLAGAAAFPFALNLGMAAYANPFVRTALDVIGTIDGVRNFVSDNGVSKTVRLAKEGDTWGAVKSGIGDVFDIASIGDLYTGAKTAKNVVKDFFKSSVKKDIEGGVKGVIKDIFRNPGDYPKVYTYLDKLATDTNKKWLDKPMPLFKTISNKKLPERTRRRIFKNAYEYNNMQKDRIGLQVSDVPDYDLNFVIPTTREQILNTLSRTTSDTGTGRANAQQDSSNDTIKFFLEGFFNPRFTPNETLAHEVRHRIQHGFTGDPGISQKKIFNLNDIEINKNPIDPKQFIYELYMPKIEKAAISNNAFANWNIDLLPAAGRLYVNYPNRNSYSRWIRSMDEFDADLAKMRERYKTNMPFHEMPASIRLLIVNDMSRRFGIPTEVASKIATDLSIHGYRKGGKLNTLENGGDKDNSYIPNIFLDPLSLIAFNKTNETKLGVPYRDFNSSDYSYYDANKGNMPTESRGHWTSRNNETGQILKATNHPTFLNELIEGLKKGYVPTENPIDSLFYSTPKPTSYPDIPMRNLNERYNIFEDDAANNSKKAHRESLDKFIKKNPNLYGLNTADFADFFSQLAGLESSYKKGAGKGMIYSGYYGLKDGSDDTEDEQHKRAFKHLAGLFQNSIVKEDILKGLSLGYSPAQILAKYWNQGNRVTQFLWNGVDDKDGKGSKISEYGWNITADADYLKYLKDAITDDEVKVKDAKSLNEAIVRVRKPGINYSNREEDILKFNTDRNKKFDTKKLRVGDTIYLTPLPKK